MIRIVEAKFLTSASSISDSLSEGVSEVVFLGRSNVGKSSIINAVTNSKNLAKSSSTPGKTRLINFFDVRFLKDDESFNIRFVDLPGFGYAKVSKSVKNEWQRSLNEFLLKRDSIRVFIHLVDARHPRLEIDKMVGEYLDDIKRGDQKVLRVFTKIDKLNQKEKSALKREYPDSLMISNSKKTGIDKLKEEIFKGVFEI